MRSLLPPLGITIALLAVAATMPAMAGAQTYITQWGSSGNGNGQFISPYGVGTDASGNVYVVDNSLNRIQVFTSSGVYVTQWGSLGAGNGQFNGPLGVATDASGNVYVIDSSNIRVQKFGSLPTPTKSTTWGHLKSSYR